MLEDAYFYLNQAKSLSDTPAAKQAKQRHMRACVLFSWQSLEYIVKDTLKTGSVASPPNKFSARLSLALAIQGSRLKFDAAAFRRFYGMRNDVVHVNTGAKQLSWPDAEQFFGYCKNMHLALMPKGHRLDISLQAF